MLPDEFVQRLYDIYPHSRNILSSFSEPHPTAFRINTLRSPAASSLQSLREEGIELQPVRWFDEAFWVPEHARPALLSSSAYEKKWIYIQNLSSMVPVLALAPEPGERILDLAAAPGSKTLQIACRLNNVGEIAAVEVVKKRFFKLRDNLSRHGATCVKTFFRDGTTVWRHRPEYFDRILLDAPCSSEGRFRTTDPETFAYWSLRKIKEMANKQKRLIYSAFQSLRPGGIIVYSTCSFAPEENESIIHHLVKKFGDAVEIEKIDLDIDAFHPPLKEWKGRMFSPALSSARRIIPDGVMEGFFICRLRKTASTY